MHVSSTLAVGMGTALGLCFALEVSAQGVPSSGQTAKPAAQQSIVESAGQVKTDSVKTKDSVKAMDVNKATKDAGQVKTDVKILNDKTKDLVTNPLGK